MPIAIANWWLSRNLLSQREGGQFGLLPSYLVVCQALPVTLTGAGVTPLLAPPPVSTGDLPLCLLVPWTSSITHLVTPSYSLSLVPLWFQPSAPSTGSLAALRGKLSQLVHGDPAPNPSHWLSLGHTLIRSIGDLVTPALILFLWLLLWTRPSSFRVDSLVAVAISILGPRPPPCATVLSWPRPRSALGASHLGRRGC